MNPTRLTNSLQTAMIDYLTTIFDVNRDGQEPELADALKSTISVAGALFNGPFLEIAPPYLTGETLQALCDEQVLSPKLPHLPCFRQNRPVPLSAPLYAHQEKAIRKLCSEKRSIVVSSGTGSGKTECFLLPILNDLLLDPTPGVRAVLIYPLNALVNDQLDRLRVLLRGTNITFGRYTSELADTTKEALQGMEEEPLENEVISREQIRNKEMLPQILITNYAMLEYLLIRPEDSILFDKGLWRFVVLDEAHTYAGAQGIEVAMLLRRLKQRLNRTKGDMRCIATSATLTSDDAQAAVDFATTLFDEDFEADDIIFGAVDEDYVPVVDQHYDVASSVFLHPEFPQLLKNLRGEGSATTPTIAQQMSDIGLISDDALGDMQSSPQKFLYDSLLANETLTRLRQWMLARRDNPAHLRETAEFVFGDLDSEQQLQALYHLIELGALARPNSDSPSLLPARYHLFARAPQGIWVCLNPACSGKTTSTASEWSRMFSERRETCDACDCHVYPLVVCRECGQVFVRMWVQDRQYRTPSDDRTGEETLRYFTWKPVHENRGLGEIEEQPNLDSDEEKNQRFTQDETRICLHCGFMSGQCSCGEKAAPVNLYLVNAIERDSKKGNRSLPVEQLEQCPRCFSKAMNNTEIVTTVSVGGVTPLSILTYELYRQLPVSSEERIQDKPGEGRKLITFYDNRQGAARFAAFLQDIVNSQNYRHVFVQAVRDHFAEETYLPSVTSIAQRSVTLAWQKNIFHNDPDTDNVGIWRVGSFRMTGEQRAQLNARVIARLLAEFTTGRDDRQSLEKLGVIGVTYFEEDDLDRLVSLADRLGLEPETAKALVEHLLDNLRKQKVMTLPRGVEADNAVFGRNIVHESLVRKQSGGYMEQAWIGATSRQYRRRLVQTALRHLKLSSDDRAVEEVLNIIFDWLVDESDLFKGTGQGGYQLKHERIFLLADAEWYRCTRCQRLYCRGDRLPCTHPDCGGLLERVDVAQRQESNYFFGTYQRNVLPMRVEEHTAQLDSKKGRDYQDGFRNGDINVLSCSTTFEMGIDLGDLQAVVMNNVPPTVANYRQRAGRAGRRTSGTAFILTWSSERPHDQNYFRNPPEIIRGAVRTPYIALDNAYIRQRHVNALLLSAFLRYLRDSGASDLNVCGAFFDAQGNGGEPHYNWLEHWLELRQAEILLFLTDIAETIGPSSEVSVWIKDFSAALAKANGEYHDVSTHYRQQVEKLETSMDPNNLHQRREARAEIEHYDKLLDRLRKEFLIDYLSKNGVLPSYSFPLYTVQLMLPPKARDTEHLRLDRDLRQAIREYAPGSEVVADKRIWRSGGLQFFRDTVQDREYRICPTCNNLQISRAVSIPLLDTSGECPICGEKPGKLMRYVTPDGFRADPKHSGAFARQYVVVTPSQLRSGLIPATAPGEHSISRVVRGAYERTGQLLYVNEGRGRGFRICLNCGMQLGFKDKRCKSANCPGTLISEVALGHVQETDTLHLRFEGQPDFPIPSPLNQSFWLSLMTALIHGASRALQIERRDIDGVLTPRKMEAQGAWEQTIVLYDNVPGGAGHVRRIQTEFPQVVYEALRIVNCTDCAEETSCYHCLRDYSNQLFHSELRRGQVKRFLEALQGEFNTISQEVSGAGQVVAANLPHWLIREVEASQKYLQLAADSISLETPRSGRHNWLDVLYELRQRNVDVDLYLTSLPDSEPANLSIARHLQVLIERGMRLWEINKLPEWHIVMDSDSEQSLRAIRCVLADELRLDADTGAMGLVTTIHFEGVLAAREYLKAVQARKVQVQELDAPARVQVRNVRANERVTEDDLFGTVFSRPVKRMLVNDAYLYDRERIVHRLGAYVELAERQGALELVTVITKKAGQSGNSGNGIDQERAEQELTRKSRATINFKHSQPQHDRFIEIERTDGTKARILIGQGLDFIQSDGRTKPTYIVIEEL